MYCKIHLTGFISKFSLAVVEWIRCMYLGISVPKWLAKNELKINKNPKIINDTDFISLSCFF